MYEQENALPLSIIYQLLNYTIELSTKILSTSYIKIIIQFQSFDTIVNYDEDPVYSPVSESPDELILSYQYNLAGQANQWVVSYLHINNLNEHIRNPNIQQIITLINFMLNTDTIITRIQHKIQEGYAEADSYSIEQELGQASNTVIDYNIDINQLQSELDARPGGPAYREGNIRFNKGYQFGKNKINTVLSDIKYLKVFLRKK